MKKIKEILQKIRNISILLIFKIYLILFWHPKKVFIKLFRKEDKIKILHIWNVAGVSNTLSFEQRKLNVQSDIISRIDLDLYHFHKIHPECFISLPRSFLQFYAKTLFLARKYDILHIHWYDWIIPYLRFLYNKKIIIIHYHGSDIRYRFEEKRKRNKYSDFIAVSTSDLIQHIPESSYIPNPVDLNHFTRKKDFIKKTALTFQAYSKFKNTKNLAEKVAKKRDLKLTIINREKKKIPYPEMPRFLEKFEFYIDIRQEPTKNEILDTLSLTALQALGLKTKVIFNNKVIEEFPKENNPTRVAKQWIEVYKKLKKERV